jgi:hypothetical protein
MNTELCFKDEMKKLDEKNAKADENMNCDKSLKSLKNENEKLLKRIEENEKRNEQNLNDTTLNPAVSVSYIIMVYSILLAVVGIFYNSLLTNSIQQILNGDTILVNFLKEKNTLNYGLLWTKIQSCLNSFRFYLFVVTFIATIIVNVGIIYMVILKGKDIKNAIKIVSLSSIAIIGVTNLLTNNVYFVKIFENTFGYAISSLFSPKKEYSLSEFMNSLFSHNLFDKGGIDFAFLFSSFRLDNLGDILRDIGTKNPESKYDFHLKADNGLNTTLNNDLNLLANMVVMKNTIGYTCWVLFATITSTIVSVKYLSR